MITFNPQDFLRDYWQKKPCVLRNALPDFTDFLDEHELAGLAMEPELDSRIISENQGKWSIEQGPFSDFTACQGNWTLLVQGVDKVMDEGSELMSLFNFIPNWRVDDLMISYAVAGAGVGPHVDQYDVFLVQGKGCRRWRVGEPHGLTDTQPVTGLCQVEDFQPVIDCELQPGDILYIPPGWPHDGVTIDPSLTYSIGFRAPEQSQLAGFLAEHLQTNESNLLRYTDPDLTSSNSPSLVSQTEIHQLKQLLHNAIDSQTFTRTLMTMLSEQGLEPDSAELIAPDQLQAELEAGLQLTRFPGCRPLLTEQCPGDLFINGDIIPFNPQNMAVMADLVEKNVINLTDMESAPDKLDIFCTFSKLIIMGYWEI